MELLVRGKTGVRQKRFRQPYAYFLGRWSKPGWLAYCNTNLEVCNMFVEVSSAYITGSRSCRHSVTSRGQPYLTRGLQAVRRSASPPDVITRQARGTGSAAATPLAPKPEPAPPGPVKIGHRATATTAKNLLRTRLGDASAGTHVHCTVRNFLGRGQKSGWLAKHPVDGIFFGLPLFNSRFFTILKSICEIESVLIFNCQP